MENLQDLIKVVDEDTRKQLDIAVNRQSVINSPTVDERLQPAGPIIFNIANQADEFIPWGYNVKSRDKQLRGFWPTEPYLASAVYTMTTRMSVMEFKLRGADPEKPQPKNTIRAIKAILNNANRGQGWQNFVSPVMTDLYTQDNGAFIEIIRQRNRPDAAVAGIAHLDSARCFRTGDPEVPVIYLDRFGKEHKMKWWTVVSIEDMPSPVEEMFGVQYCACSRALRAAQIIRDISLYKHEKISGMFARSIHFISGIIKQNIEDAVRLAQEQALNANLTRYMSPPIIPTLDPEAGLQHVQIDLASLPDGFDEQVTMQWYIAGLAIAFGVDYQEFAPLPGGALGSSQQSEILDDKSRGKGSGMAIRSLEHVFNDMILPANVVGNFETEDARANAERANARFLRGKDRAMRVDSGELDIEGARRLAVEDGDLPVDLQELMDERGVLPPEPQQGTDPLTVDQVTGGIGSRDQRRERRNQFRNVFLE